MNSILFVCWGNICRSPAAEGVFRKLVAHVEREDEFDIDSAGTIRHHNGQAADSRMQAAAAKRGYRLDSRSRCIEPDDFERFDLIVTMDDSNYRDVKAVDPGGSAQIVRMCDFCTQHEETEVPDPYYGGNAGFEQVLDILEDACHNLLEKFPEK